MQFVIACSRYSRGNYKGAVQLCDKILQKNPKDEATWQIKCQALTRLTLINDLDTQEVQPYQKPVTNNPLARQGTTLNLPKGTRAMSRANQGVQRISTRQSESRSSRMGTRLQTQSGRQLRLGTASLVQKGGIFIDIQNLNMSHQAQKRNINKSLFNYIYYCVQNFPKAFELANYVLLIPQFKDDHWWVFALAKTLYRLTFYQKAFQAFQRCLSSEPFADVRLLMSRTLQRMDRPEFALQILQQGLQQQNYQILYLTQKARIYQLLGNQVESISCYNLVLLNQSCNLEAFASLAAYYFYKHNPQISLKFYERLLLTGHGSPQLFCNMAVCYYYAGKFDLFGSYFKKAMQQGQGFVLADIYYNIACVVYESAQMIAAAKILQLALTVDPKHSQARNNLSVIYKYLKKPYQIYLKQCPEQSYCQQLIYNRAVLRLEEGNYLQCKQCIDLLKEKQSSLNIDVLQQELDLKILF